LPPERLEHYEQFESNGAIADHGGEAFIAITVTERPAMSFK
jgi:hypothetical protein